MLALTEASAGAAVVVVDTASAGATITDDGVVTVEITPAGDSVPEGGTWATTVTLSMAVAEPVSVRWRTSDGTAVSDRDYGGMSAEVVFAPGERSKPIAVKTMKDGVSELAEMFYVALDGAAARAAGASGRGGRVRFDTARRSGYIECNVEYPDGPWTIHTLGVPKGTDVGTPVVPAAEGDPAYTYSLAGGAGKFEVDSATGQISTTEDIEWRPGLSYSLTVTAEHTCGASGSIEVQIILKTPPEPVDSIPDFRIDVNVTDSVDVSGKFRDRDGDFLRYNASSSAPSTVSVTMNGNWVVFTLDGQGDATVTVTATDPWNYSAIQAFLVEYRNDPPVCDETPLTLEPGESVDLSPPCTDADDHTITYSGTRSDDTGVATAQLRGTTLTISGVAAGRTTVRVTADDGHGGVVNAAIPVTVNTVPVCDETPLTLEPGESVDLSPPCTDGDGHTLTYSGGGSDDTGVATAQLRGTTLTISGVAAGRTTVRVTANDGHGGVVNAVIPVTVNTVPVCDETPVTLEPGESVDLADPCTDGDGHTLTYSGGGSDDTGAATAQLRGTTLTISGVAAGRTTVRVTANDGHGGVVNAAIPVTVNTVPVCDETPLTLEPGESVDLSPPCTDGDGHTLTYSGGGSDDTGVATAQLRGTTLTISGVAAGRTTVRVTANDGHGGVVNAVIPVTVNTVPVCDETPVTLEPGESVDLADPCTDGDGHTLTYSGGGSDDTGAATAQLRGTTLTISGVAAGRTTVRVTANDGHGGVVNAAIPVTVNTVPVCDETPLTLEPGESVDLADPCTDGDGHTLTYSGGGSDDTGVATAQLRGTTLTIRGVAAGETTVRVTADDGHGGVVNAAIPVTVNTVPVCDETPLTLEPGESVDLSPPCTDGDGHTLTYSGTSSDNTGVATARLTGTRLTIRGVAAGETTVRFAADDGHGGWVRAAVPVTVNTAPVCDETPVTVEPGGSVDLADPCTDADGHTLDYSGASSDDTGVATPYFTGTTLTITGVAAGETTVRFTADDRHGGVVEAAVPVTVERSYECTVSVSGGPFRVATGASRVGTVTGTARGRDCGVLRYSLSGSSLFEINASTGAITVHGSPGVATHTATVRADDANGPAYGTAQVTITVYRPNRAPTANAGADQRVGSGTRVQLDGGGSTDSDGRITGWAWTGPLALAGANTAAPSFTAPAVTGDTEYTFKLTVTDDDGATGADEVTVTVYRPNRPPSAVGAIGALTVARGAADTVGVGAHFSDPDGDALTYTVSSADAGVVRAALAADTLVVVTGAGRGSASVRVRARDPGLLEAVQTFTVTVPNSAPVVSAAVGAREVEAGDRLELNLAHHIRDRDGDDLAYTASSSNGAVAEVSVSGSVLRVAGIARGGAEVTLEADDGHGGTARHTFTVTVPNSPPAAEGVIAAVVLHAGGADTVNVRANFSDRDGDRLAYTAASSDTSVARVTVAGSLVVVRAFAPGAAEVTVTADDGHGGTARQRFAATVPNRAPVAVGALAAVTVERGASDTVNVAGAFRDPDGEALTYTASSTDARVVAAAVADTLVVVTGAGRGSAEVRVTARDPGGLEAVRAFAVTVPNSAPAPVGALGPVKVYKGVAGTVDVAAGFGDPDNDALTYAVASSDEAVATASVSGSEVTVTGVSQGEATVTVTASDGHGGTAKQSVAVTVQNRAPAPVGSVADRELVLGDTVEVEAWKAFEDADGDALTYSVSISDEGVVTAAMRDSTAVVAAAGQGSAEVRVRATDPGGLWTEQAFTVRVRNREPAPVGEIGARTVAVGERWTVALAGYFRDDDGDDLSYAAGTSDAGVVTASAEDGELAVTGVAKGSAEVTVTADDGHGGTAQQVFLVTVPNRGPAAVGAIGPRTTVTGAAGTVDAPPYFEDPDGDDLSYTAASSNEAVVSVAVSGHEVRYRGESRGGATVTVRAADGEGLWAEQAFEVTVGNAAPAFAAASAERSVAENSAAGTAVGAPVTASDPDGDPVTYSLAGGGGGRFEIGAASGQLTVAPGAVLDYESGDTAYALRVVASDGTLADTVTVTVRVTDVGVPGAPGNLRGESYPRRLQLHWWPPETDGGAGITGYDLQWREKDAGGSWSELRVEPEPEFLEADADDLKRRTLYEARVRARNIEGAGAWSDTIEAWTSRPPEFPADTVERAVAENAPPGTEVGAPVVATDPDHHDLGYRLLNPPAGTPFTVLRRTGQIEVAAGAALDHETASEHWLQVTADDGGYQDVVVVRIRVTDVPAPGRPERPVVTGGTGEVAVAWSAPANEGPEITSYDLRYRAQADTAWTELPSLGAVLSQTIGELDPGTTYLAEVRAESSEGAGEWSEPGEGTTAAAPANRAPAFGAENFEREVAENSGAGTAVGDPVTATDPDGTSPSYGFAGDGAPFEIDGSTGQITVAPGAALNYESGDTLYTLSTVGSDGKLADTATVTVRVTNADDPGKVTVSPETGGVGVKLTATLMDEDGSRRQSVRRRWQRSGDGASPWTNITGATSRTYTPVAADAGKWLRAVFTYADGHGPGKRAESAAVRVPVPNTAPAFGAESYEREVAENSGAGTAVGAPVTATDPDGTSPSYGFAGDGAPFEIDGATGQLTVAPGAVLDYESGDTLYTVSIEATDGTLADTATVTIRVTNADDPGKIALSAAVARVGVQLTATLMDQDVSIERSKVRRWQRSDDGTSPWTNIAGARTRFYTPVAADRGKYLRAVFTYADGLGPGRRAESPVVRVTGRNVAPVFAASAVEREVAENSAAGTAVGEPVTATDGNADDLAYSFVSGGDAGRFEIDGETGRITVAEGAALDYEGGTRSHTVTVEASDGELADTATVTIRITNADDPGSVALDAGIARVGVQITATLMDQDGSLNAGKRRRWERSADRGATWTAIAGATTRFYTPPAGDEGKRLRAVFTYRDRHGPNKTAVSGEVEVAGAATPVASFAQASYTVPAGGSVDIAVTASHPSAAAADIHVSLVAGADTTSRTVTLPAGATQATLAVSAAGRTAGDTIAARLGTLPAGWMAAPPSETRIAVTAAGGSMAGDSARAPLSVAFAEASYEAAAGGPGTVVTLRIAPAADRDVSVPLTTTARSGALGRDAPAGIPAAVAFEPGDSLATFTFTPPPASPGGEIALALGELPQGVDPGTPATALVTVVAAAGMDALFDESLEAGLAVLGRAVAEGAGQAVRGRLAAAMRAGPAGEATAPARSARGWAALAAGELASLSGVPTSTAALRGAAQASAPPEIRLPGSREAARRLLPRLSFSAPLGHTSQAAPPPRFSLWAHGSAQQYRGEPGSSSASSGGLSYDGAMQAFTAGADARLGSSALAGLALMRSSGEFNYANRSLEGTLGHAMNTVHPYLFLRPSARIGLWAIGGLGSGDLDDEDRGRTLPARLRMLSGGAEIPLARRGALGLALAADAFGVSTRTGASGTTPERQGTATRARALLEASWKTGGLSLATRAGARYDGGDADTGAGAETGGTLALRRRGLDLALDTRAAFGSEGHREWGASLRIAYDPGTPGQGLRIAVSPARGQPQSGVRGLLDHGHIARSHAHGDSWRLDAETGYALPRPGNGSLDTYTRLSAHGRLRLWSAGARYDMNRSLQLTLESALNDTATQPRGLKMGLGMKF